MHIKRDISNWNIKIILSVLIGAGNPEILRITQYNLPVGCNNLNLESDQSEPLGHFFGKLHSPKKSVNFRDHSDSGLPHTILSATTEIYGQSTIYSVHIVNTFFGIFCNMFRYYVIISFFLTIKYYLILK